MFRFKQASNFWPVFSSIFFNNFWNTGGVSRNLPNIYEGTFCGNSYKYTVFSGPHFPAFGNTDHKKLRIWTLSTQWFHQRYLTRFLVRLWISFIFFYRHTQRPYFCFGIRMENSSSFYRCSIFDNTLQHQKPRTEKIK